MAKKKEDTEQLYIIWKKENYSDQKVVMPIDIERTKKFNDNEKIEVTATELNEIGYHRWLVSEVK